ncbi:MAG: hypothetical protein ACOH1Q_03410 [Thiobacillus sp.]
MNKLGPFAAAAQYAPRFFQVRRRTWVGVGVGVLVLFGLLIWAGVALISWFFGQAQGVLGTAPQTARGALDQVAQAVPGIREKLGEFVPALKQPPTQSDVSGNDIGPVARYPGLVRTSWQQAGKQVVVEFEGDADYAAVLDHYTKGFAALGFVQSVQSATPEAEAHEYAKDGERIALKLARQSSGKVKVGIETRLP